MFNLYETISTLQSSYQTIYGLIVGLIAVLSDLREGKQAIVSSDIPSIPTADQQRQQQQQLAASLSSTSSLEMKDDDQHDEVNCDQSNCYVNPIENEKGRVVIILRNLLACWHLAVNLLYLVKRAVAVKVHIEDPEKITINLMRVKHLTHKFHNKFLK